MFNSIFDHYSIGSCLGLHHCRDLICFSDYWADGVCWLTCVFHPLALMFHALENSCFICDISICALLMQQQVQGFICDLVTSWVNVHIIHSTCSWCLMCMFRFFCFLIKWTSGLTSLHFPCLFPHLSVLSLHCVKMPGLSLISGLLLCSSYRHTHGADKPKTVTYDAQIFVDVDVENNIRSCTAVKVGRVTCLWVQS